MSYGLTPYGLGAYGGTGIALALAFASSTNTVRVEFTNDVLIGYGFEDGSALRPSTWLVQNLQTGQVYTVLGASAVSDSAVDVFLLEPLGPYQEQHRVSTSTLRSAGGDLISAPTSADFAGVVSSYEGPPDDVRSSRPRDLANPVTRRVGFDNTLVIGADGDYDTEEGPELVRKLIFRRLTTPRGGFKHLPDYGSGILLKEPLPSRGSLVMLKADIERQVAQEPEVLTSSAGLSLSRDGVLQIHLRVTLRQDGTEVDLRFRADPSAGTVSFV